MEPLAYTIHTACFGIYRDVLNLGLLEKNTRVQSPWQHAWESYIFIIHVQKQAATC